MKSVVFYVIFCCLISQLLAKIKPLDSEFVVKEQFSTFEIEKYSDVFLIFNNVINNKKYHFYLDNKDEFEEKYGKLLYETRSACEDLENETCERDITIFKFQINVNSDENPLLRFKYKSGYKEDFAYVTFKEKKPEFENNAIIIEPENNSTYDVENGSIVEVKVVGGDGGNGIKWSFENQEEVENSDWIQFLGTDYVSDCKYLIGQPRLSGGCSGTETYKFQIKDVSDESLIQKIVLVRGLQYDESYREPVEFSLKFKNKPEPECSKDGYKCCSKDNKNVYYTDSDGEWGIENNDWCFIRELDQCYQEHGYNCCKMYNVEYVDSEGEWGIENDDWCFNIIKPAL